MQRMRTVDQAFQYIKEQDPDTALTKNAFRSFVKMGYIPVSQLGSKRLVKLDDVDKFLEEGIPMAQPQIGIRRIKG